VITGHSDRHLRIWDLNKGKLVGTSPADTKPAEKIVLTPDHQNVLAGLNDSIKIWDYGQDARNVFVQGCPPSDIIMKPHSTILALTARFQAVHLVELLPNAKSVMLSQIGGQPPQPMQTEETKQDFFSMRNSTGRNRSSHAPKDNKNYDGPPVTLKSLR
jgi:WD40 repeat protein